MNIRKFKAALIGLGQRGMRLYYAAIRERKDVEIVAFCDSFEPRLKEFAEKVKKDDGITPSLYTDYKKCLDESGCNCVIVATAWTDHIPVSVYAMERGIAVGCEVGGGSIRIHDSKLQEKMFELLGFTPEEAQKRFGFLMNAFKYGAPPHGGLAFGFDRLCSLFGGSESIRDYIAFPKNNAGRDMMLDAPGYIDQSQLDELYLELRKPEE